MKLRSILAAVAWLAVPGPETASGQTQIDLRSQGRNVDFSQAVLTKPFKTGTVLPATCTVGETFFKSDAAAGQNIYTCSSLNTWSPTSSVNTSNSGPGGVEVLKTLGGTNIVGRQLLPGEGIVLTQQTDTITAEVDTSVVPRYAVGSSAPAGACQDGRDIFTRVSGFPNFFTCIAGAWKPVWDVTSTLPASCAVGQLLFHSLQGAIYGCTATNTWTRLTNSGGVDMTASGECFVMTGCAPTPANGRGTLQADATAGSFVAVRVVIRDRLKLGKGQVYGFNGGAAAAFTAAIYDDVNGAPGGKIAGTDLRFVGLGAATYRQNTWGSGDVVLTPKVYWVGFSSEDPATVYNTPGGIYVGIVYTLGNLASKPGAVKCSNAVNGTGATYELPATCGTATAWSNFGSDVPIVVASAE